MGKSEDVHGHVNDKNTQVETAVLFLGTSSGGEHCIQSCVYLYTYQRRK